MLNSAKLLLLTYTTGPDKEKKRKTRVHFDTLFTRIVSMLYKGQRLKYEVLQLLAIKILPKSA